MKSEKGITLITIAIYILIVFIVLIMLATITTNFRDNMKKEEAKSVFLVEYDKFSMYFLNDIKNTKNSIEEIDALGEYVKFTNGNKYIYMDNKIYLENLADNKKIIIANNIEECIFTQKTAEEVEKTGQIIINVVIKINNTIKNVDYILGEENTYNNYQDEQTYSYSEIPVEGITLNKDTTSLIISGQEQLTAVITPENATNTNISWSSDNINIVTVDINGLITAIGSGTANITVTTEYGNYVDTCAVTVSE